MIIEFNTQRNQWNKYENQKNYSESQEAQMCDESGIRRHFQNKRMEPLETRSNKQNKDMEGENVGKWEKGGLEFPEIEVNLHQKQPSGPSEVLTSREEPKERNQRARRDLKERKNYYPSQEMKVSGPKIKQFVFLLQNLRQISLFLLKLINKRSHKWSLMATQCSLMNKPKKLSTSRNRLNPWVNGCWKLSGGRCSRVGGVGENYLDKKLKHTQTFPVCPTQRWKHFCHISSEKVHIKVKLMV